MKAEYNGKRQIVYKQGKEITNLDIEKMVQIGRLAHHPDMAEMMFENVKSAGSLAMEYMVTGREPSLILGEDWYLLFFEEERTIHATDLARIEPINRQDGYFQQRELQDAFMYLLDRAVVVKDGKLRIKEIATELREDTSYYLFLLKKKHGVVEQLYKEEVRSWDCLKFYEFSEQDQIAFLKTARTKRESQKADDVLMHTVWFKPSEKTIDKILQKRKQSEESGEKV